MFEQGLYIFRQFLIDTHGLWWRITIVHRELALLKQQRGGMSSDILQTLTFFLLQPLCTSIAKSPISCGTSCSSIVIVVMIPTVSPARNEAPIAKPSVKLCAKSAARFRYPAIFRDSTRHRSSYMIDRWSLPSRKIHNSVLDITSINVYCPT